MFLRAIAAKMVINAIRVLRRVAAVAESATQQRTRIAYIIYYT